VLLERPRFQKSYKKQSLNYYATVFSKKSIKRVILTRVVDPDPDWIRIQSLVWIRIRIGNPDPDPGARTLRNFSGKNALFSYLKKKFCH
jgi:hypothetical protein